MGFFKRRQAGDMPNEPGTRSVAVRVKGGSVPPHCVGVVQGRGGATRRVPAGARLVLDAGETGWCFNPGPYQYDLVPFAAAPEVGLRLAFVVDAPDPRVAEQRFDLFLASEAAERVGVIQLGAAIEDAVRRELAQGNLDLPPCATLDEWDKFRAGFDQLLYTRFGVTVDECMPVDLGDTRDYPRLLLERAELPAATLTVAPPAVAAPDAPDLAGTDARALRRLFLELPRLTSGLRLVALPPGQDLFRLHQALLHRLDHVSLSVATMPALGLAAPGVLLDRREQRRRVQHMVRAADALDEAWALLARLKSDSRHGAILDNTARIVANLEAGSAGRRAVAEGEGA